MVREHRASVRIVAKNQCEHIFFHVLSPEFMRSARAQVQGLNLVLGHLTVLGTLSTQCLDATLFDAAAQAAVLW